MNNILLMGVQEDLQFLATQSGVRKNEVDTVAVQAQLMRLNEENERRDATLVGQTNPRQIIEDLKHYYRCEVEVPNGRGGSKWERPQGIKPLLNERGVHSIIIDVFGYVNQGTILSNLSDDDVGKLTIECGWTVAKKLKRKHKEFNCDEWNMTTIVMTTATMAKMALLRAKNQGERGFLRHVVFQNQSNNSVQGLPKEKRFWEVWK